VDAGGRVEVVVVVANSLNGNVKIKNEIKKQKKCTSALYSFY
jgi:hypothetical protein